MQDVGIRGSGLEAFSKLIHPVTVDQFIGSYWQQNVLVVNRDSPRFYDDLLTIDALDALLTSTALPGAQVNLGKDAVGIAKEDYVTGGYVNPRALLRLHKRGNTIILRSMHLWLETLQKLCSAMESFFHCDAQANIYMTPARTQSSYPHWDAHDIFVIQLAGSKRWRLHSAPLKKPLYTYEFNPDRHEIGPETGEFTLHAGDIAYVPRGVAHNPEATEYAVHISLGVLVKTWADVFAAMYENIVRDNPEYRAALPVLYGRHQFDRDRCASELEQLASAFGDRAILSTVLARLTDTFLTTRTPDMRHAFSQVAEGCPITPSTCVEVISSTPILIEEHGDDCRAIINGLELRVSGSMLDAMKYVAHRSRLRVSELPGESDARRVALAERLVDEGMLRVCRELER